MMYNGKVKYTIGFVNENPYALAKEINAEIKKLPADEMVLDIKYSSWGHEVTEMGDTCSAYSAILLIGGDK